MADARSWLNQNLKHYIACQGQQDEMTESEFTL